jgi:hypothetical protein
MRLADRLDLAFEIGGLLLPGGNVGGEFHDLERLAPRVEDRVVGALDPDLAPALAEPAELAGLVIATIERRPELAVWGAVALRRIDEQAVMLAADLVQRIAHRDQELAIRRQDRAIHAEFDDRLRGIEGSQPCRLFRRSSETQEFEHDVPDLFDLLSNRHIVTWV